MLIRAKEENPELGPEDQRSYAQEEEGLYIAQGQRLRLALTLKDGGGAGFHVALHCMVLCCVALKSDGPFEMTGKPQAGSLGGNL